MKEKVIDAFNQLSGRYEHEVDATNVYNTEYERPSMVELLPETLQGWHVLDAGCAAGWYTEHLLNKGAVAAAIDISLNMVEAAKRRTKGKAKIVLADLTEPLPFEDDAFDLIISSLTMHYVKDWDRTFSEFARILKSGGIFQFSVHHPMSDIELSPEKAYFETERIADYWNNGTEKVEVQFYRRPLHQIVNVTTTYFELKCMKEPIPTEQFKKRNPSSYEKLLRRPNFLIIQALNSKKRKGDGS